MGDRGNICFLEQGSNTDAGVYLYAHWHGSELLELLAQALDTEVARNRWDDGPYLTRIVIQNILDKEGVSSTGWGISTGICDNEHEIVYVDPATQSVRQGGLSWSFEDLTKQHFNERGIYT